MWSRWIVHSCQSCHVESASKVCFYLCGKMEAATRLMQWSVTPPFRWCWAAGRRWESVCVLGRIRAALYNSCTLSASIAWVYHTTYIKHCNINHGNMKLAKLYTDSMLWITTANNFTQFPQLGKTKNVMYSNAIKSKTMYLMCNAKSRQCYLHSVFYMVSKQIYRN